MVLFTIKSNAIDWQLWFYCKSKYSIKIIWIMQVCEVVSAIYYIKNRNLIFVTSFLRNGWTYGHRYWWAYFTHHLEGFKSRFRCKSDHWITPRACNGLIFLFNPCTAGTMNKCAKVLTNSPVNLRNIWPWPGNF